MGDRSWSRGGGGRGDADAAAPTPSPHPPSIPLVPGCPLRTSGASHGRPLPHPCPRCRPGSPPPPGHGGTRTAHAVGSSTSKAGLFKAHTKPSAASRKVSACAELRSAGKCERNALRGGAGWGGGRTRCPKLRRPPKPPSSSQGTDDATWSKHSDQTTVKAAGAGAEASERERMTERAHGATHRHAAACGEGGAREPAAAYGVAAARGARAGQTQIYPCRGVPFAGQGAQAAAGPPAAAAAHATGTSKVGTQLSRGGGGWKVGGPTSPRRQ